MKADHMSRTSTLAGILHSLTFLMHSLNFSLKDMLTVMYPCETYAASEYLTYEQNMMC